MVASQAAPSLPSAEPIGSRRLDIQGIRAVAVLAVVAYHAGLPVPGGFVGVDVFFVVSGFVITAMLGREWCETGTISLRGFFLRRFKRLMPALALVVGSTTLVSFLVLSPFGTQQNVAKVALGAMLLVGNLIIARTSGGYFDAAANTNPLLHTWSLSVEEQFYLVFPGMVWGLWALGRRRRRPSRLLGVVIALASLLSFALAHAGSHGFVLPRLNNLVGFYSPLTRAWEFGAGALLALVLRGRGSGSSGSATRAVGLVGAIGVLASFWILRSSTPTPGAWSLLPVGATVLLLVGGLDPDSPTSRFLSTRPMIHVGDWSYSIYLWHWPFVAFAGLLWGEHRTVLVAATLLSLVPAAASYRYVEAPIRRGAADRRLGRTAVLTFAPALAVSMVLLCINERSWWSEDVRLLKVATSTGHLGHQNGCDVRLPLGDPSVAECVWNPEGAGPPIYLLGDSNADHFSEGFVDAARKVDRPVFVVIANRCPFVDLWYGSIVGTRTATDQVCASFVRRSLEHLRTAPKGLVVISNSAFYLEDPSVWLGGRRADSSNDPEKKAVALEQGLERTARALEENDHQVLIIEPVPRWTGSSAWDPLRCSLPSVLSGSCSASRPLRSIAGSHVAARSAIRRAAHAAGARTWEPAMQICPHGMCSTMGPGFVRYRDPGHISVRQSRALAPAITALLTDGLPGGP